MRSSVRVCTGTVISTTSSSSPPQTASSSSLAKLLVPVMRTSILWRPFERASDPNLINSWVAGGLDSAWRAVDQYINLNQSILPPGTQEKFHTTWGSTEYLDETSNKKLVEQNRKLMERHLVIALHKSGIRIPKE